MYVLSVSTYFVKGLPFAIRKRFLMTSSYYLYHAFYNRQYIKIIENFYVVVITKNSFMQINHINLIFHINFFKIPFNRSQVTIITNILEKKKTE